MSHTCCNCCKVFRSIENLYSHETSGKMEYLQRNHCPAGYCGRDLCVSTTSTERSNQRNVMYFTIRIDWSFFRFAFHVEKGI